ncbi:MAG: DUF2254 domain-containing protein [Pelobium sp.]
MWSIIKLWIKDHYHKILNSISFYPALIGLLFLILAIVMMGFDFSIQGKDFKSQIPWLSIKDSTTARSIISAVAAGVISLAVFSFSMVMIVLNQAASQMSNRVLDKLIGNRFQQIVLGIYIGTIVYSFFLLSTIRDIDSGLYIPSLSIYLLIIITIFDLFLFIYFLHYITQSVKYEVIIKRIYENTLEVLEHNCNVGHEVKTIVNVESEQLIYTPTSGIFETIDKRELLKLCDENDIIIQLLVTPGTSLLKGMPIAKISKDLEEDIKKEIGRTLFLHKSESIEENYFYGFRQLTEIAMKALSPGINDPGTAIIALRSLFELYAYRINHFPLSFIKNKEGQARIILKNLSFDKIFEDTIIPIYNYGKNDRLIQQEMLLLLPQLQSISQNEKVEKLISLLKEKTKNEDFSF